MQEGNLTDDRTEEESKGSDSEEEPRQQLAGSNGKVPPIRMYRSVVLTSVRQFTDPESPSEQTDDPLTPQSCGSSDDQAASEDNESASMEVEEELHSDVDFGYFNAAFEDFDEEKESGMEEGARSATNQRLRRTRALEVVRGEVNVFNEEDEEMASTSSNSDSSDSSSLTDLSETNSVKRVHPKEKDHDSKEAVENVKMMRLDDAAEPVKPDAEKEASQVTEAEDIAIAEMPQLVQVTASQLPSPEVPSVEILNSRPLTPEETCNPVEDGTSSAVPSDELVKLEGLTEHPFIMVQVTMERFNGDEVDENRVESPLGSRTPPPTPAHDDFQSFQPPAHLSDQDLSHLNEIDEMRRAAEKISQQSEPMDQPSSAPVDSPDLGSDDQEGSGSAETIKETDPVFGTSQIGVHVTKPARRMSRDEGTQTDLSGFVGRLHAVPPPAAASPQAEMCPAIIQHQPLPLQVDLNKVSEETRTTAASLSSPTSDGEVFSSGAANQDDEDSFYGSDKEMDGEVVFSHTESSHSGTTSSGSDVEPDKKQTAVNYCLFFLRTPMCNDGFLT